MRGKTLFQTGILALLLIVLFNVAARDTDNGYDLRDALIPHD